MNPTRAKGKSLTAIPVDENKAVGSVTLNELEYFGVKSPLFMAKTGEKKFEERDIPFKHLRQIVQRLWDKQRVTRAGLYKTYIGRLMDGTVMGDTPPVTLFIPDLGEVDENAREIEFSYTSPAIAIDGETQLQARFDLRSERPETGDVPFAITIHHGISEDHAMKVLHDFNHYAKPISEAKLGVKNIDGPMSVAIGEALKNAGVAEGEFNSAGQVANKKTVAAFGQSMAFIAGYAAGHDALKKSATTWYDVLNTAGTNAINGHCVPMLSSLYTLASAQKAVGGAQPLIWQAAGVLAAEGVNPASMHWDAAFQAYADTAPKKAGKQSVSLRLPALYAALKQG